jgi:hypothetical protein
MRWFLSKPRQAELGSCIACSAYHAKGCTCPCHTPEGQECLAYVKQLEKLLSELENPPKDGVGTQKETSQVKP